MMVDETTPLRAFLTDEQIAALPDQWGVRSWAFESYLELHHDAANAALVPVLEGLRERWLQGFKRKPNAKRQENLLNCLRVILLNVMRVQTVDNTLTVGIPSGKGRLNTEKQYRPAFMTVQYHLKALALLQDSGLVRMVKAGHKQEDYAETARYALTDAGRDKMLVAGLTRKDFTIAKRDEVILLKDADKRLIGYTDTPAIKAMRANLRRLNDLLAVTDIGTTRATNPLTDFDADYSGQNADLYRVFNNGSFDEGGRFYGGWWQHAKKHLRRCITIDGQRTVEADFKGLHPAILFAKQGLPIPEDPYALVPGVAEDDTLRGHAKTTFLALLNADKQDTSEPRDFDAERHGMTKQEFQRSVRDAFLMLPGIFSTGRGLRLQREDSDMAEQIMLHFADRDIPVLPVHDSFIIAKEHNEALQQVMVAVFHKRYGQTPRITVSG